MLNAFNEHIFSEYLRISFIITFIILGQSLFALGGFMDNFVVMEVGRFVFGIGGESLAVAQNTYASSWFSGGSLNMVFGLQLSVARLGSTVNFQVVGPLFHTLENTMSSNDALGATLMISGIALVVSFVASIVS